MNSIFVSCRGRMRNHAKKPARALWAILALLPSMPATIVTNQPGHNPGRRF